MSDAARRRRFVVLAAAFALTGGATVFLGPVLPQLKQDWGVGSGRIAWLFAVQFAASSVGSVLSTRNLRAALLGGYAAIGAGLLWMSVAHFHGAVGAAFFIGLGLGGALPASNLLVAADFPARRGAALAKLNVFWGLGAAAYPLLLAETSDWLAMRHSVAVLGVLCLVAVLPLARVTKSPSRAPTGDDGHSEADGTVPKDFNLRLFLPFAALFCFYVGTEATVGGWLVAAAAAAGVGGRVALWIGGAYWALLLLGRATAPRLLQHLAERSLYNLSLALAGAGLAALLLSRGAGGFLIGACLVGFGLAPLYPLTVSLLTRRSDRVGDPRTGWVFTGSGVGGACFPWLAGQVQDLTSFTGAAFVVPVLSLGAMTMIFLALSEAGVGPAGRP